MFEQPFWIGAHFYVCTKVVTLSSVCVYTEVVSLFVCFYSHTVVLRNAVNGSLLFPGGGRSYWVAHSTCLFYLAKNFPCSSLPQTSHQRYVNRGTPQPNIFRQHAQCRTTQTAPEWGHKSKDGPLRCSGRGIATWKFTEPVHESRGSWCNCETCCVLWARPFWCQRSKYLSSEFMECVHCPSRAVLTGKFQHHRAKELPQVWLI